MNDIFDHTYKYEYITEYPNTDIDIHSYTLNQDKSRKDGIIVKIYPQKIKPWIGIFEFGHISNTFPNSILYCPNQDEVCVISRGNGYFVNTNAPDDYTVVEARPVKEVLTIMDQNIIVFADFTHLIAYGEDGVAWKSKRLSWDGIKELNHNGNSISGKGWSAPNNNYYEFKIDCKTGKEKNLHKF